MLLFVLAFVLGIAFCTIRLGGHWRQIKCVFGWISNILIYAHKVEQPVAALVALAPLSAP